MFVFAPSSQPVLAVDGRKYAFFPVRRVYVCESDGVRLLASDTLRQGSQRGSDIALPGRGRTHWEHAVRVAVAIGKRCAAVDPALAAECVYGMSCAVQIRDLDAISPEGLIIVSPMRPASIMHLDEGRDMWLYVNNQKRQGGRTDEDGVSPLQSVSRVSQLCTLEPGDVVLTQTVSGTACVTRNDLVQAGVGGIAVIKSRLV